MDLIKYVKSRKESRRKFAFYKSLGYSEETSAVLSILTYGSEETAWLVKKLGEEGFLTRVFRWLEEQDAATPAEAVQRYWDTEHPPEAPFAGVGGLRFYLDDEDCDCESEEESVSSAGSAPEAACAPSCPSPAWGAPGMGRRMFRGLASVRNVKGTMLDPELTATDSYETIEEKKAEDVLTSPTSTFRMTTSNASMGVVFNQLRSGREVRMDQVRIEELLNAFDYRTSPPEREAFGVTAELRAEPSGKKLLYVNVQASEKTPEHQNIVLLLDVSGSMCGNAEVTQETAAAVISRLNPGDVFSLVTYSSTDETLVRGFRIRDGRDRERLLGILMGIEIDGCTWGSAGIETAYRLGAKYYDRSRSNQVILITDGDLNFGITSKGGLRELIEHKKHSGLFLSVIGTGLYNYKDDNLEVLSKHGNGTYCVVNTLDDVEDCIVRRYAALTHVVARDVKAQVEFNPRFVKRYRLLGYENRRLSHRDFSDDAVISEPYGSGGHGVALYELEMRREDEPLASGLRYQTPQLTGSDELCTVRVRYKDPLSEESRLIETAVLNEDHSTENLDLAYALFCIAEGLRGSELTGPDEAAQTERILKGEVRACTGHDSEKLRLLTGALREAAGI